MNIVHKARIWLIRFAKVFPFLLCAIVLISYTEDLVALLAESYYDYNESVILYKPVSWFIGKYFVYDWYTIIVATILSFAMETCWYNKASIIYLCINAWERDYFITIELYPEHIYMIVVVNLILSGFFVFRGTTILFAKEKRTHGK